MQKLLTIGAWIVSVLFHPLNMVVVGSILIAALTSGISLGQLLVFSKTLMLMLFVLPLLFVPFFWIYSKIVRREFSEKHQRLALLFSTSIIYIFTSYKLLIYNSLTLVNTYILACSVLMVLSFFISIFWKISLHAIGIGGFLALILQLSLYGYFSAYLFIPAVLLIVGLVLSARLYLSAHTPTQVAVGFALGVSTVFVVM